MLVPTCRPPLLPFPSAAHATVRAQVVFERCGKPGGVQVRLLPLAIIGLVVYVLGYPLVVGFILYRNRDQMREDQLLRAMGTGSTRLTNPHGRLVTGAMCCGAGAGAGAHGLKPRCCGCLRRPLPLFLATASSLMSGRNRCSPLPNTPLSPASVRRAQAVPEAVLPLQARKVLLVRCARADVGCPGVCALSLSPACSCFPPCAACELLRWLHRVPLPPPFLLCSLPLAGSSSSCFASSGLRSQR